MKNKKVQHSSKMLRVYRDCRSLEDGPLYYLNPPKQERNALMKDPRFGDTYSCLNVQICSWYMALRERSNIEENLCLCLAGKYVSFIT
jgi:hypothetical protein